MINSYQTSLAVWLVIIVGVLLRALVMIQHGGPFDDPDNYLPLARSIANGEGFTFAGHPTAYRPPLYPILLAPVAKLMGDQASLGVSVLHLILGGGTVWLTVVAARRYGLSPIRSAVAGFIVACDPVLVWQSRSVMTETPAAFLIAAALSALTVPSWKGPVLGGLAFGLAGLCRPSLLLPAAFVLLFSAVVKPGNWLERLMRGAQFGGVILVVMSPWMIRNWIELGEPIWTTTHGGYTLALANNPIYYRDVLNSADGRVWSGAEQFRWWDSVNQDLSGLTEPEADRRLSRDVWKLARAEPRQFGHSVISRLSHFWSLSPASDVYPSSIRWLSFVWTFPLWLALILGLTRAEAWRWPAVTAPCVIMGLTLVHAVFWTDMRMRAPIVPAIAVVSAGAFATRFKSANRRLRVSE